jgi:hypothetical protein
MLGEILSESTCGFQSIVRDTKQGLIFTAQRCHAIPSTIRIAKLLGACTNCSAEENS